MGYSPLNLKGKAYIRKLTDKPGNSLLTGKFHYKLPSSTISDVDTVFVANVVVNNVPVTTNKQIGEYIILWIDKYSKLYALDANIIAAQMNQESKFTTWAYSYSGALGISQFLPITVVDLIKIRNKTFAVDRRLTTEEVNKIFNGIVGDKAVNSTFYSKENRKQLHQNLMDNPEIVIKMQCMFMNYLGRRNNNLASSALFAYNRSGSITSQTYYEAIKTCSTAIGEGLKYVRAIFKDLATNFGYSSEIVVQLTSEENGLIALTNEELTPILNDLNQQQTAYINDLHFLVRFQFANLISEIQSKTGYKVIVTSGYRSFQKQLELSEENQHNAEPGKSHHNYGLALDINLVKGEKILRKASSKQDWIDTGAIEIAKNLGFTWGGDFSNYHDPVHFDLQGIYPIARLVETANKITNNDLTKVVGNRIPLYTS